MTAMIVSDRKWLEDRSVHLRSGALNMVLGRQRQALVLNPV